MSSDWRCSIQGVRTMISYKYQKDASGFSVWTVNIYGDRRDWVADCRTARDAQRLINRLYKMHT